ncbi:uncharacterized protein LOC110226952 [Arabidopsis lyrata subsp. lyrata]|uniref:uncharacterized protein LOC110226952 n=1 Tax=Arabidopsis lyrata subsp. lyrata TaxID=81972 RepID=UPI000A29CE2E|nr:uncharacterized protein LOC110226952 [Arabidopsis lyrata subsp. lyrata]|eukprot:XP_020875627.1 uncharacterized protein LOC110226952 [Arabidopsis lyrata subsp. lyrata]
MSLLLNQPSKLCFRKPVLVRSSPHPSNALSSLVLQSDCHSFVLICADPCGGDRGMATIRRPCGVHHYGSFKEWDEVIGKDAKLCRELRKEMGTIGSSNGWLPTLKDGVLRLREININNETDPKRISLPPLVTLPYCQTQYVTNVAMSSSFPEEEDCVVAVKFLGPQLSFCRPARSNSKWINTRITDPCFFSSPVMFSKKDDMFRIAGSGGHLIGSWDLHKHCNNPKFQILRFPKLSETKRDLLDSCYTSEHLVESLTTSETFLVKLYRKTAEILQGIPRIKTEAIMVFRVDEEGNAVYTQDIGDQSIFLTNSEAFCVPLSSTFCLRQPNYVKLLNVDEHCSNFKLTNQNWDC